MRNKFVVKLILILLALWGCVYTVSASEVQKGTPVLEVPEWYFDFGEVTEGTEYLHAFAIRNLGDEVLEISTVRPG